MTIKHAYLIVLVFLQVSFASASTPDSTHTLILFYEGSNFKIDSNYRYKMQEFVLFLKENRDINIHIRGHVCCGADKRLSRKRAKYAFKYLKKAGIRRERLSFEGYSNDLPLRYPEKEEEDAAMNRRVDFILSWN